MDDKILKILVIEDNEMFRKLALEMLSGHELASARGAKEGIEKYNKNLPDIVFLDIGLPDGDGYEVLDKIMETNKNAFVVMLTASNIASDVKKSRDKGAQGYIIKPFSRKQIKENIDQYYIYKAAKMRDTTK